MTEDKRVAIYDALTHLKLGPKAKEEKCAAQSPPENVQAVLIANLLSFRADPEKLERRDAYTCANAELVTAVHSADAVGGIRE